MEDHWKYNGPPVYVSVASFFKLRKKRPVVKSMKSTGAMQELANFARAIGMAKK